MKAVDYLKVKGRMTNGCDILCKDCPLNKYHLLETCKTIEFDYPEKAVEIVEKWAKENPVKTYKSVLLEKLPNVELTINGIPSPCIKNYFGKKGVEKCETGYCKDCWNREYKEEENV